MSAGGQFKKGSVSANPVGRPTKDEAIRREFQCVRTDWGLEDFEFDALVAAFVADKPRAIDVVLELIHRRAYADLLKARAEPDDEPNEDIF